MRMTKPVRIPSGFTDAHRMNWNDAGGGQDPWGRRSRQGASSGQGGQSRQGGQGGSFFSRFFGGGMPGGLTTGPLIILVAIIVIAYGYLGLYQLDQSERGVVLRFGKLQEQVLLPGLNWQPPLVDSVTVVNTTRVNSYDHDSLMLTEDENIVDVALTVQYQIGDAKAYTTEIREPEAALAHATESALRHVVGSSVMNQVITEGRAEIAAEVQSRLQSYLDRYRSGLSVVKVNIDRSGPPEQVQDAFDDVQKAKEDEVRLRNEANRYAEKVVPEARGDAQKQIEGSNAYRDQVIAQAQGEAERFRKLLAEYQLAESVTRDRLYIDAMESVLSNSTKVMVDVDQSNNVLFLPLDQLTAAAMMSERRSSTNDDSNDSLASNMSRSSESSSSGFDRARR